MGLAIAPSEWIRGKLMPSRQPSRIPAPIKFLAFEICEILVLSPSPREKSISHQLHHVVRIPQLILNAYI
jgi:hypothetical protein